MAYGIWRMAYGVWRVACGVWRGNHHTPALLQALYVLWFRYSGSANLDCQHLLTKRLVHRKAVMPHLPD